jgi:hypothetical protein
MMAEHLPANDPNQAAMPLDDLRERAVIAMQNEPHEQLVIGSDDRVSAPGDRPRKDISQIGSYCQACTSGSVNQDLIGPHD